MSTNSNIEWCDATWNPVTGCSRVSLGCAHCYAERMTKRLAAMGQPKYQGLLDRYDRFNGTVRLVVDALTIPIRWRNPRTVFVNSMSDLFHKNVTDSMIDHVFAVMLASYITRPIHRQHTFIILTKRSYRMRKYFTKRTPEQLIRAWANEATYYAKINDGDTTVEEWCAAYTSSSLAAQSANSARSAVDPSSSSSLAASSSLASPSVPSVKSVDPPLSSTTSNYIESASGESFTHIAKLFPLPNVILGVSVESNDYRDRIYDLIHTPAACRAVSAEPLLGPLDLSPYLPDAGCSARPYTPDPRPAHLDWVIAGGESGPGARPLHPNWVRSIRDQCVSAHVPLFFKQWGEWLPGSQYEYNQVVNQADPDLEQSRFKCAVWQAGRWLEVSSLWCDEGGQDEDAVFRVGKHRAGNLLDGQLWNQRPVLFPSANSARSVVVQK